MFRSRLKLSYLKQKKIWKRGKIVLRKRFYIKLKYINRKNIGFTNRDIDQIC